MQNFAAIVSGVSAPKYMTSMCLRRETLLVFFRFWGFLNNALELISTQIRQRRRFEQGSVFWGTGDYI